MRDRFFDSTKRRGRGTRSSEIFSGKHLSTLLAGIDRGRNNRGYLYGLMGVIVRFGQLPIDLVLPVVNAIVTEPNQLQGNAHGINHAFLLHSIEVNKLGFVVDISEFEPIADEACNVCHGFEFSAILGVLKAISTHLDEFVDIDQLLLVDAV